MFLLLAIVIAVYFPVEQLLASRRDFEHILSMPDYLLRTYQFTLARLWLTVFVIFAAFLYEGVNFFETLGLVLHFDLPFLLGVSAAVGFIVVLFYNARVDESNYEKMSARYAHVAFVLPATWREFKWMVGLSITAGICEEIIYRAFLFWVLMQYTNIYAAVLVVNILFALAHIWSGPKNMAGAFGAGLGLSAAYILTRSLWIPILLHAFGDIQSGWVGYQLNRIKASKEKAPGWGGRDPLMEEE